MNNNQNNLNHFLVKTFNTILRHEEKSLESFFNNKLSVKEFHVIEAIYEAINNKKNSMHLVANALEITMGSLTVAVKTLEAKGFVKRITNALDKRIADLVLTPEGENANQMHMQFHSKMIELVVKKLSKKQQKILAETLLILENFFKEGNFKYD